MSETPFQAQRRTLRELKEKQNVGEHPVPVSHISVKAQARRDAEATAAKPAKKVSKKKAGTTTTD